MAKDTFVLHLFVAGTTPNAIRAITNIKKICAEYLADTFELQVIDIYQQPDKLVSEQIMTIPALIRKSPLPEKIMIGDLSNEEQVLKGLGIKSK
jgi:circadian clock protein KaiB